MRSIVTVFGTIAFVAGIASVPATRVNAAERATWEMPRSPGPCGVEVIVLEWLDQARSRQVPVKIYYPKDATGLCPVIIFSHGLGGSRETYEYLGRHWASHGYVSLHVQHEGSDTDVWKKANRPEESLRRAAADVSNAVNRPKDVSFAIDQIIKAGRDQTPLRGRIDAERIGVAGHSFGAYTALAVAGQIFSGPLGGKQWSFVDRRVRAAVAMSAPAPRRRDTLDAAFGAIKIPCLHMTGTLDDSPIGETKAAERRIPFDHILGADQYLVTFTGGDHMIFSGRPRNAALARTRGWQGDASKDAQFQTEIRTITTAFWDAYLRDISQAKSWLAKDGCEAFLGADATLERKLK